MTLRSPWMRGPEGRQPKREPSPERLGLNPEHDLSAGGAALNLGPLVSVTDLSRRAVQGPAVRPSPSTTLQANESPASPPITSLR
jgi:hypothetical protein